MTPTPARLEPGPPWLYPLKAAATRARSAAWLARSRGRPRLDGIRILFYHRVSNDRDELAVRPARFRAQMERLAASGFRAVDVAEVAARLADGGPPGRIVGLSFDDGYRDVATDALPVLAEHGFRATVFVATGVVDGTARFDGHGGRPPVLDWDEIRELDGGVLRFEAHTVTHPNLLRLDEHAARREIAGSKQALERRLARPVEVFCYPAGLAGARERELVREAGFRVAASCEPGANTPATDPLALRRCQVDARDRLIDFEAKLGGGHDTPLPLRGAWRRLRYGSTGTPARASTSR